MSVPYPGVSFTHAGYMDQNGRFAMHTAKQIRQQNTKSQKCVQSTKPCNHINRHKREVIA